MTKHTIADEGNGRKYWTQTPNIVFDLGLRPFPLALYGQLKRIAGDGGECGETARQLADRLGCSPMAISKALAELALRRSELGGKPLVKVVKIADGKGSRFARNVVTLVDVWPENMARYGKATVNTVDGTVNTVDGTVNTVDGHRKHSVHPKEQEKNEEQEHTAANDAAPANGTRGDAPPRTDQPPAAPKAARKPRAPKASKPARPPEYHAMHAAIAEACRLNVVTIEVKERVNLDSAVKALLSAGATPETIASTLATWYAKDWRGKLGQAPTLSQIREAVGAAMLPSASPAAALNGHARYAVIRDGRVTMKSVYVLQSEGLAPPDAMQLDLGTWSPDMLAAKAAIERLGA